MAFSNLLCFLPEIITVLAALIAWRSMFAARNSAREANRIQERLLAIEAERQERERASLQQALFTVEVFWRQDDSLTTFVRNVGNGTAYKAQFFTDGKLINAYPTFRSTSLKRHEPTLEPESVTTFEFELKSYLPRPERIAVVWIDAVGKQQQQQMEIFRK